MKKELNIKVTIKTVPHPNPERAIDLIANMLVTQLLHAEKDRREDKLQTKPI